MKGFRVTWRDEYGFKCHTDLLEKVDAVKVRDALRGKGVVCEVVPFVLPDSPQPPSPLL